MGDHQLAALASPTAVIAPLPPLQIVQSKLEEEGRKEADGPPRMQLEGPEGGLQGWLNVAGAFLVLCATFGYINASFGVFQAYYQESYSERSPSDISWIGSVGMTIEFGMALATGPIFDRGYFHHLMIAGTVSLIGISFAVSACTKYWQTFLAQAVGFGFAMGCLYMPCISVLGHFFIRRRSLVMGIGMAGSSVGGIFLPLLLNNLFPKQGFAASVRAATYVVIGCMVVANLIMRPRYPTVKVGAAPVKRVTPLALVRDYRYLSAVLAATSVCFGVFFPIAYIQVYAEHANLPRNISNNVLTVLNVASFFGRILPNLAADTLGVINSLAICSAGVGILIFALFGASTSAGVMIFAILYGFFSGGVVSLLSPLFIATAERVEEIGSRQGVGLLVTGLGALFSSPIAGALITKAGGDFKWAIVFAGSTALIGAFGLFFFARPPQAKRMQTWRV